MELAPRVLAFLRRHALLEPGERVLTAVSGGADSLALLHILHELAPRLSLALVVAHLEHGLRGAASAADARAVEREARRLGWSFVMERVCLAELAVSTGVSLETAGREARYDFFRRAARAEGCSRVATGHTADDAVETLLLHLMRGAGLEGLQGIPRERPLGEGVRVIRPLLEITRAETVAYCAARGLAPREDATNRDPAFARNRVRHRLLPALEAEAPPGLRRRLLGLMAEVAEEVALLEAGAAALLSQAIREETREALSLDAASLAAEPPARARRALRQAVRRLDPGSEIDRAATEMLLRLALGDLATGVTLPGGRLRAARRGDVLRLAFAAPAEESPAERVAAPLPVPGRALLGGWEIRAEPLLPPPAPAGDPGTWVLLDAGKVRGGLAVRFPRPGDRVRPLGMHGRRKLHDLFVDRKLPRPERAHVPLVVDAEKILWVIGFCVSEEVRLDLGTGMALRLEARRHATKGGLA